MSLQEFELPVAECLNWREFILVSVPIFSNTLQEKDILTTILSATIIKSIDFSAIEVSAKRSINDR